MRSVALWEDRKRRSRVAGLADQCWVHEENDTRRSRHRPADASQKQRFPELYRRFDRQQLHLASWLSRNSVSTWLASGSIHTWSILRSNEVNRSGFHIVDDVIAGSGDEMSIWEYLYSFLWTSQHMVRNYLNARNLPFPQIPRKDSGISLPYRRR